MKPLRRAIKLFRKLLKARSRANDVSPTFEERFLNWHDTQARHPDDHSKLLAAFLADGGHRLTAAAKISNGLAGKHDFSDFPSTIGLRPSTDEYQQALSSLRSEGFAILPHRLSPEMVHRLSEDFSAKPMRMVSDESSVNGKYGPLDLSSPMAEKYEVATSDVLNSPNAQSLLFDSGILSLAQDYLGSAPILDIATSWFSFPVGRSSSEAATEFHFDLDRTKWVKVFYFLTDVDERTGAHLFIPGSQSDGAIPSDILRKGYSRLADEEVARAFPKNSWASMQGAAGTILLEDTRGLHKGMPLLEGHRLVLQFQYSVDLFGGASHLSAVSRPVAPQGVPPKPTSQLLSAFSGQASH